MNNAQQQAILARDMLDMTRDYQDNADILKYLKSFASSIARLTECERQTSNTP